MRDQSIEHICTIQFGAVESVVMSPRAPHANDCCEVEECGKVPCEAVRYPAANCHQSASRYKGDTFGFLFGANTAICSLFVFCSEAIFPFNGLM